MSDQIQLDGLGIAPGVLDTIVTVAASQVDGVAAVGSSGIAGFMQRSSRKASSRAVDVVVDEDSRLAVAVHLKVFYGQKLKEVGEAVQVAVKDALSVQASLDVASVDVYIDSLVFVE